MSAASALGAPPPRIRPAWLRPAAAAAAIALHAAAATLVVAPARFISPVDAVEVTLVSQGDAAEQEQAAAPAEPIEAAPTPRVEAPPLSAAESEAAPAAPPPRVAPTAALKVDDPEAAPLFVAEREAAPLAPPQPRPVAQPKDERPTAKAAREPPRRPTPAAERSGKSEIARRAARRGAEEGEAKSAALARASYASLLAAELARHKVYPAAARAAGVTGSVGVAFTVGPSGEVIDDAITRSSGDAALDGAVRAMMAAVRAPPPPGGLFRATTTVTFALE